MKKFKPFKNMITDRDTKEFIGDKAIELLHKERLINLRNDLNHLSIEFGYLFEDENYVLHVLIKVIPNKRFLRKERVFYLWTNEGELTLLNDKFTDKVFDEMSSEMLIKHQVDINLDKRNYFMELY